MKHEIDRWWIHVWSRGTRKALIYLLAVAIRAAFTGGGVMVLATDLPPVVRGIVAAVLGVYLSVYLGVVGLRMRLGDKW